MTYFFPQQGTTPTLHSKKWCRSKISCSFQVGINLQQHLVRSGQGKANLSDLIQYALVCLFYGGNLNSHPKTFLSGTYLIRFLYLIFIVCCIGLVMNIAKIFLTYQSINQSCIFMKYLTEIFKIRLYSLNFITECVSSME